MTSGEYVSLRSVAREALGRFGDTDQAAGSGPQEDAALGGEERRQRVRGRPALPAGLLPLWLCPLHPVQLLPM